MREPRAITLGSTHELSSECSYSLVFQSGCTYSLHLRYTRSTLRGNFVVPSFILVVPPFSEADLGWTSRDGTDERAEDPRRGIVIVVNHIIDGRTVPLVGRDEFTDVPIGHG